jgi:hypothetical protein
MTSAHALLRLLPLLAAIAALAFGVAGGLARFGLVDAAIFAAPTRLHAALMICGFLGTVISLERAVALRAGWAFGAPLASAAAVVLALRGADLVALATWLAASLLLLAASVVILRKQDAAHARLLVVAAAAWCAGLLLALGGALWASVPWDAVLLAWLDFLILTIAAERLELTRLMRRRPIAPRLLAAIVVAMLAGTCAAALSPTIGHATHALACIALAAWLFAFDLARHTVRTDGVARFAAVCLLGGYAWLAVAGAAQFGWIAGLPVARDLWLHAIGLGFVVSMIFGHAPIILPAVTGWAVRFSTLLYAPLLLLHASLLLRVATALGPWADAAALRAAGAWLNAAALLLFALLMLRAVAQAGRAGQGRRRRARAG